MRPLRPLRVRLAATLFAACLLVVGACGDDDDAGSGGDLENPSTTQQGDPTLDSDPEDGATPGGSSGSDSGGTGSGRSDDQP